MPYGIRYLARETLAAVRVSSSNSNCPLVSPEVCFLEQIPRCLRRSLRCLHWPHRLLSLHQPGDYVSRPIFPCLLTSALSVSVSSTPETFDIVSSTVDVSSRKNLAQISKVLSQVTSGSEFGDDTPSYIPINEYVKGAILQITSWLFEGRHSHECTLSCIESAFSCQRHRRRDSIPCARIFGCHRAT